MSQAQAKHTAWRYLAPQQLDDDAVNRLLKQLKNRFKDSTKVLASGGEAGPSAIVWKDNCLVYNSTDNSSWNYYQLPQEARDWAIGRNSARLWLITKNNKLAILDLRNGEWINFDHKLSYEALLYAEEDKVMASCPDLCVVDVLSLQDFSLKRIVSIPFPADVLGDRLDHKVIGNAFLPEEEQLLALVNVHRHLFLHEEHVLLKLSLDGQLRKWMSRFQAEAVKLCYPFVAFVEWLSEKELFYADLRKDPIRPAHIKLEFQSGEEKPRLELHNAFVFSDELIVAVNVFSQHRRALVRVRDHPEVLHYEKGKWRYLSQLGKFLIDNDGFVYDLVDQRVVWEKRWSALFREAIQYELERQRQLSPVTKPLSIKAQQEAENSTPNTFQVFIRDSSVQIAHERNNNFSLRNFISSSSGHVLLWANGTAHFLTRDSAQIHSLLPEPRGQWGYGWPNFTFDEQERMWFVDYYARFAAIVSSRGQEKQGFVLDPFRQSPVKTLAAYANSLAIALYGGTLIIYHYDGQSIEETFRWTSDKDVTGIKPDVVRKGWWIVVKDNVLSYLEPKTNRVETFAQLPHDISIFGDWPDQTYFAYVNETNQMCYTSNPLDGWQETSLRDVLEGGQSYRLLLNSLHRLDGGVFFLLASLYKGTLLKPEAYLFMTMQSDRVEPLAMFQTPTHLTHYGDWLLLYADTPIVPLPSEITGVSIDDIPENNGILFYSPSTGQFSVEPHVTYSIGQAMYRFMKKGKHFGFRGVPSL